MKAGYNFFDAKIIQSIFETQLLILKLSKLLLSTNIQVPSSYQLEGIP